MPTPSTIRDIVRRRTNISIDLSEAVRLARHAAGRDPDASVQVHGQDAHTGHPAEAALSVRDLLAPPTDG